MLAVSWEPHHVLWDCVGLISSREKGNFYYIQVQIIHISQFMLCMQHYESCLFCPLQIEAIKTQL